MRQAFSSANSSMLLPERARAHTHDMRKDIYIERERREREEGREKGREGGREGVKERWKVGGRE